VLAQGCGIGEERGAGARIHTLCGASSGHPKCCVRATCVHDPGHCEQLAGRRDSSSVRSCGASSPGVRGSPVGCITEGKKNFCCVTTRRRNIWLWNGLGRGLGLLAAHSFCLGMLGLDLGVSAAFGLPQRRPPAVDLSLTFRFLAESLVPTARLVLTSALLVQAGPRARAAGSGLGTSLSFNVVGAHGRSVSQGKARGGCVSILPGRYQNENKTIACKSKVFSGNKTENKTALDRRREKDDQIESHHGGSPKTLANGSENLLGNIAQRNPFGAASIVPFEAESAPRTQGIRAVHGRVPHGSQLP
jgi:hypothetical protein